MLIVSFVQSEFQERIALLTFPGAKIVKIRRHLLQRIFDTIYALIFLMFRTKHFQKIIIHDHRNPLVLFAIVMCNMKRKFINKLYIGDDGMYSVLVDIHGSKYLYWNTRYIKKILMKYFEKKILNVNRLQTLKKINTGFFKSKYFVSYFDKIQRIKPTFHTKNIFIDQPGVIKSMSIKSRSEFIKKLELISDLTIVLHPRQDNASIYYPKKFKTIRCFSTESEIRAANKSLKIFGFFSTTMLAASEWEFNVTCFQLPHELPNSMKSYGMACSNIIKLKQTKNL